MNSLKSRDELLAELAELEAKNEAATSWGAAVGARQERIKQIQSTLRHPPYEAPQCEVQTASGQADPMDITQPVRSGLARAEAGEESGLDLDDVAKLLDAYDRLVLGAAQEASDCGVSVWRR